jgi:hypothetical protein
LLFFGLRPRDTGDIPPIVETPGSGRSRTKEWSRA